LVFTSPCPESLLDEISANLKLAQKTMTFLEANIDFQIYMDNIFLVNTASELQKTDAFVGYKVAEAQGTKPTYLRALEEGQDLKKTIGFRVSVTRQVSRKIVNQLLTLCSCLYEKPRIYSQKES